jgi:hypothetical protein
VHELITPAGVGAGVDVIRIDDADAAERAAFLGSPTVRVNGEDVEPGAAERDDFGLRCRLFAPPTAYARFRPTRGSCWPCNAPRRSRGERS